MLYGGQNRLSDHLQASPTRCGSLNGLSEFHTTLLHALLKTKRTLRTSTRHIRSLQKSKHTELLYASYTLFAVKTDSLNYYKSSYMLYMLYRSQNGLTKLYKLPTRLTVVKMVSPSLYEPPTRFAVVKTASPMFYQPPTRFTEDKTHSSNFYTKLIHALRWSKRTLSTSHTHPPTRFAVVKTDSYMLCRDQNRPFKLLQAVNKL